MAMASKLDKVHAFIFIASATSPISTFLLAKKFTFFFFLKKGLCDVLLEKNTLATRKQFKQSIRNNLPPFLLFCCLNLDLGICTAATLLTKFLQKIPINLNFHFAI